MEIVDRDESTRNQNPAEHHHHHHHRRENLKTHKVEGSFQFWLFSHLTTLFQLQRSYLLRQV
jgi:hypothetical protein